MISVTDLRNGTVFQENKDPWIVLNYEHIKVGRGSANVKIKARNLRSGSITEKSYMANARVEDADVEKVKVHYLYRAEDTYIFMDSVTFEQFSLTSEMIGESTKFLKEGIEVILLTWDSVPLSAELPRSVEFSIAETGPGERGNSVSNVLKPAVLETGATISVPLFINVGDIIRVDTRSGEYIERVAK